MTYKLFFKHSTSCSISRRAYVQMKDFLKVKPNWLEYEIIDVVAQRSRSNQVAEQCNVRHESPQIIMLADQSVLFSYSHNQITKELLLEQLANIKA